MFLFAPGNIVNYPEPCDTNPRTFRIATDYASINIESTKYRPNFCERKTDLTKKTTLGVRLGSGPDGHAKGSLVHQIRKIVDDVHN